MKLFRNEEGGMVLEAALVLPLFLSFILMLIAFIQISLSEMALQSAVSETTKVLAANMYPVDLLYAEAKNRWDQSAASGWIDKSLGRISSVKQKAVDAEQFIENYESFIPDLVVKMMEWEKTQREELEALGRAGTEDAKQKVKDAYTPLLNSAFKPLVGLYANKGAVKQEKLQVTGVVLPDLSNREQAFIGIEAQYELPLNIPFFKRTVLIRKKALERVWIGGGG